MKIYSLLENIFIVNVTFFPLRLPRCDAGFVRVHVEARQLLLFIGAVALAACWVVYRKEKFAWILQDILGFAFRYVKRAITYTHFFAIIAFCVSFLSVNMIRQVRLPSLKICTLLLVLLFFYDIFFVFITPLLTKVMTLC